MDAAFDGFFLFRQVESGMTSFSMRLPVEGRMGPSYAKIHMMKARLPRPVHESYLKHRRQVVWQVVLPVALTAFLIVALIALVNVATFNEGGDVGRWAAISTIWIIIPVMIAGLLFLVLLVGFVYLMKRLLELMPTYTGMAQDYVHKFAGCLRRGADAVVKPIFFIEEIRASVKAFFGRK
jgi:hypothetical protein